MDITLHASDADLLLEEGLVQDAVANDAVPEDHQHHSPSPPAPARHCSRSPPRPTPACRRAHCKTLSQIFTVDSLIFNRALAGLGSRHAKRRRLVQLLGWFKKTLLRYYEDSPLRRSSYCQAIEHGPYITHIPNICTVNNCHNSIRCRNFHYCLACACILDILVTDHQQSNKCPLVVTMKRAIK